MDLIVLVLAEYLGQAVAFRIEQVPNHVDMYYLLWILQFISAVKHTNTSMALSDQRLHDATSILFCQAGY